MAVDMICPIGVANTDRFMDAICEMTGAEIHYSLKKSDNNAFYMGDGVVLSVK
jgi:hypothetical protein